MPLEGGRLLLDDIRDTLDLDMGPRSPLKKSQI